MSSYRLGMSARRLDDVIAEVMERTADGGVRIIGVDGPSGSGKSTLAARIAALIGVASSVKNWLSVFIESSQRSR